MNITTRVERLEKLAGSLPVAVEAIDPRVAAAALEAACRLAEELGIEGSTPAGHGLGARRVVDPRLERAALDAARAKAHELGVKID